MRAVPMHRALVRPPMLLGCDRTLLFFVGMISMALAVPAGIAQGRPLMVLLGAAVFGLGSVGLAYMGARDPQMREVFVRRQVFYSDTYVARARWDRPGPRLRRYL